MLKQKITGSVQEVILPDFPDDDDNTVTTTVTKSRRVSFGPNFVKEFIVDSAISAQCMAEYEQHFPSSDSSNADTTHGTFSRQENIKVHKTDSETAESQPKQPKFASTICFSADSPTADMEFTEGCITLAKSILDKKNKEMTVFIQAKPKGPKEEKAKAEETDFFEGSQFEMSMTQCLKSKEKKREEKRFDKTKIFGKYEDEMSMTRCERFFNDEDEDESKENRMPLEAIMQYLDKDESDSDLFNPDRSLSQLLGANNSLELSEESMEISGDLNPVGSKPSEVPSGDLSENEPVRRFGPLQSSDEEIEAAEHECSEEMRIVESPKGGCLDVSEQPTRFGEEASSEEMAVEEMTGEEVASEKARTEEIVSGRLIAQEMVSEEIRSEEMMSEKIGSEEMVLEKTRSEEMVLEKTRSEEMMSEKIRIEEMVSEKTRSEEMVSEKMVVEEMVIEKMMLQKVEIASGKMVTQEKTPEKMTQEKLVTEEMVTQETAAEKILPEETVSQKITPEETLAEETITEDLMDVVPSWNPPPFAPRPSPVLSPGLIPQEDDSPREPSLGDLKVIESLKEQAKEKGCAWSLRDVQHPQRRSQGLISFSCRLLDSTTSLQFSLKMSGEDALDSCSLVTDSSVLLDEERECRLPEYTLAVGFGFDQLKKYFGALQGVATLRHVPYYMDRVNSFLSKMNGHLQQIHSILTSYPGSRLNGCRLSFRLFSFPMFLSCVVSIDLSNVFGLSKASLLFEHDFGCLDEKRVCEIFEESLKGENSLCEFVVRSTRYLVEVERQSGYLSKRKHIRLLPDELRS